MFYIYTYTLNMYRYMYVSACQIQKHNKRNNPDDAFNN